jgi:DNA-binding MarR family transcriptional regulator
MSATRRSHSRRSRTAVDPGQLQEWVERVAMFFHDQYGLPPITGRIFGWLMACDPPEQSGAQIADAIGASRASITTNIRLLTAAGLVRRLTRPGERTAYYVLDDNAWERVIRRRADGIASFREITRDGIELLGSTVERAGRVRAAHDAFEWFAAVLASAPPPQTRSGRQ